MTEMEKSLRRELEMLPEPGRSHYLKALDDGASVQEVFFSSLAFASEERHRLRNKLEDMKIENLDKRGGQRA